MQAGLYGKHGLKSTQVPATPQSSLSGILGQEIRGYSGEHPREGVEQC
jgi:hypothetical protein